MSSKHYYPDCVSLVTIAQQELQAYFNAVKELFGSEQARLSAEDWLYEFEQASDLPLSTRQLRTITMKVARTLASRLNLATAGALL